ncbi:MAG: HAMP domain-containing histidine kinase [Bacteroidales bacterium]|nr:HAMP domain-containing histidine kinase [Bacteroidales bacterium]
MYSLLNNIFNRGIQSGLDFDRKRAYRQLNAFNFSLTIIAASAVFFAVYLKVKAGIYIQIVSAFFYLGFLYFTPYVKLQTIRIVTIVFYETHIFIVSLFAVSPTGISFFPWFSSVFITYMLYPMAAALFDMSVFRHMLVAFVQIIFIQFIGHYLPEFGFPVIPEADSNLFLIVESTFTMLIAGIFTYLIYAENKSVKLSEIVRSQQLEKLLAENIEGKAMLRKQAKKLKKLDDTKNKFFSIIAHDLKSPFNAVLGLSKILRDKSGDKPEFQKHAANLYETALNSYNLIEDLLEWSRAQSENIPFKPRTVNLKNELDGSVQMLQNLARKKQISIESSVQNNIHVFADINLLHSILRNLITNAVKFSNNNGAIQISAKMKTRFVEVAIHDNGVGMTENSLKGLFRLDKKESSPGTQNEMGTGLGLLICKEFIDMHNGKIWAESTEGKGSTFYFTLPLAKQ